MKTDPFTLITGASRGIGRALAHEMASRGHNLMLSSLPGEGLGELCRELSDTYNIETRFFETDLTLPDSPGELFAETVRKGTEINILINNAGTGIEGPLETYTREEIDTVIFLNIRALTLLTYYIAPKMRQTGGYILNISSFGIYVPAAYKSVYLASKTYIYYFSRALESEFRGSGVRVCVFMPGPVRTNKHVLNRIEKAGWAAKASQMNPEEIASTGIREMFNGRKTFIPGRLNRFFFAAGNIVPEGIIIAMLRRIFRD